MNCYFVLIVLMTRSCLEQGIVMVNIEFKIILARELLNVKKHSEVIICERESRFDSVISCH